MNNPRDFVSYRMQERGVDLSSSIDHRIGQLRIK